MRSQQVRAIFLSGALLLAAGSVASASALPTSLAPSIATAPDDSAAQQCTNKRNQPRMLIAVFQGTPDSIGLMASDSVRQQWAQRACAEYFPIPYDDIKNQLAGAGFDPRKALSPWDQTLLAKLLSADIVLTGFATNTGRGWTITPSLAVPTDHRVTQPLEPVTGPRLTLASRSVLPGLQEALKALPEFRKCWIAEGEKRHEDAVKAANAAIAVYPPSTMARICLAQALEYLKASPDSIIKVTSFVLKVNPKDYFAIRFAERAERANKNVARADSLVLELLKLNPTDVNLQDEVIRVFADRGDLTAARKQAEDAEKINPGAPEIVSLKATVCFAQKDYPCAISSYEELAKADTSQVTIQYFERLAFSHRELKQFKEAASAAGRGRSKFPDHVPLIIFQSQMFREGGDTLQAIATAKEALAKDPTRFDVYITILNSMASASPESLIAQVKAALPHAKTQPDSAALHNYAFSPGQALFNQANEVRPDSLKTEADWAKFQTSINLIEFAHSIIPDNLDKFYLAADHYFLAGRSFNQATALQDSTGKVLPENMKRVCELTTDAYDRAVKSQNYIMEGGGRATQPGVDVIRQIMGAANQIQTNIGPLKAAACKAPGGLFH